MDAAGAESRLTDQEARALLSQEVLYGNAHVFERDLTVAVARVVPEHRKRPHDVHPGRVHRDEDEAVLEVGLCIGVALTEEEADLAARVGCAARPPLTTVDD